MDPLYELEIDEAELIESDDVDEPGEAGDEGEGFDDDADGDDEEEEEEVVTIVLEDGTEADYALAGVLEVEEQLFAVLVDEEGAEDDDEEGTVDVVLAHFREEEDGTMHFSEITDEALYAKVQAAAEEFFAQMDGEEDGEHDHDHDHVED